MCQPFRGRCAQCGVEEKDGVCAGELVPLSPLEAATPVSGTEPQSKAPTGFGLGFVFLGGAHVESVPEPHGGCWPRLLSHSCQACVTLTLLA